MRHLDFNWVYLAMVIGGTIAGSIALYFDHQTKVELRRIEAEKRPCTP
jgi:phosphatidylserine decarboxylase